jgi:anti-anti-sigma factor
MRVHRKDDMALVELTGRLIYDNLAVTHQELEDLLMSDLAGLFLQLDELSYVDSSALGMLLSLNNHARTSGKQFTLVSPSDNLRAIFTTTRLDCVLKIADDEDAVSIKSRFDSTPSESAKSSNNSP